jgi:hypothetical protein
MTKEEAANKSARAVSTLLMLSGFYLSFCGIIIWRSVDKECDTVFKSDAYANLYLCFHVEVIVSFINPLTALVLPQRHREALEQIGFIKRGKEIGQEETAINAEEHMKTSWESVATSIKLELDPRSSARGRTPSVDP